MGFQAAADFFFLIQLNLLAHSFELGSLVLELDVLVPLQDPIHQVLLAERLNSAAADVLIQFFANYYLRK